MGSLPDVTKFPNKVAWVEPYLLKKGGYHAERRWLGLKYKYALFLTQPNTEVGICLGVLNRFELSIDLSSHLI